MEDELISNVGPTFKASVRSVGTACTLAGIGVYLHRRGFVAGEGKKTLALIAQQVTIPLLLFTKIIFCNQDWSSAPCPDITKSLEQVWILLLWPIYTVGWGLVVGWVAAKLTNTPKQQIRPVLAACSFSNCTGLPITLLLVVHANFPSTSDLGRIDPTLFLSVYLLLYPILQWGIGGWLLAPEIEEDDDNVEVMIATEACHVDDRDYDEARQSSNHDILTVPSQEGMRERLSITSNTSTRSQKVDENNTMPPLCHNVLNNWYTTQLYSSRHLGIGETDASMYLSQVDLTQLGRSHGDTDDEIEQSLESVYMAVSNTEFRESNSTTNNEPVGNAEDAAYMHNPSQPLLTETHSIGFVTEKSPLISPAPTNAATFSKSHHQPKQYENENMRGTVAVIVSRCVQPPVIGAIAGIIVASTPLRGVFVDLKHRSSNAPLQWFFDGLYSVGQAAVPLNMMILGANVSASLTNKNSHVYTGMFSTATMVAILLGKMIIMPIIGILSAYVLKYYLLDIPDAIEGAFYLVIMIVFITPTANNVMVMVELSGSGVKEGMARAIMLQYAVAPVILCLTMSIVVGIADGWS